MRNMCYIFIFILFSFYYEGIKMQHEGTEVIGTFWVISLLPWKLHEISHEIHSNRVALKFNLGQVCVREWDRFDKAHTRENWKNKWKIMQGGRGISSPKNVSMFSYFHFFDLFLNKRNWVTSEVRRCGRVGRLKVFYLLRSTFSDSSSNNHQYLCTRKISNLRKTNEIYFREIR